MCLIAFNWQPQSPVPLFIAANRDEFYARPTLPLHRWEDKTILAGKDLLAGGTWLGVSANGRLAALTNYREVSPRHPTAPSRGDITSAFLRSSVTAQQYLHELASQVPIYNPFNLLVFDGADLMGFESRHSRIFKLPEGVHAVSNADFNTPWPKLKRLREGLGQTLISHDFESLKPAAPAAINALFALLSERRTAQDSELPQTGLPYAREKALSAEFVFSPHYGTRASSVVIMGQGRAEFIERSFDANGFVAETHERLQWEAAP